MKQYDAPPAMKIDPAKTYRATISTKQGRRVNLTRATVYIPRNNPTLPCA